MSFYERSFHSFLGQTMAKTMPFKDGEIYYREPLETRDSDGLTLCTEYLGFESYDMKMSDNEVENKMTCHVEEETEMVERKKRKTKENVVAPERKREFPPPLSSLNGRGQRSFYLRSVRKDGRLELTKVMIDRPEIFHASREDGRLRLHLVDASCDSQEMVDIEDESKGLEYFNNENDVATDHRAMDLSKINDDSGSTSWQYKSNNGVLLKSDGDVEHYHDEHGDGEWRFKSGYKIIGSRNHDENHNHHHHHHIHPYHQCNSNNNKHLWSRSFVKTR